jgi:hypothetical protein
VIVTVIKRLVFVIAITVIASCGQNEPLANYKPKSPKEEALKSVLLDFQNGVNTIDTKKIESLIHPKASLMTGRERKTLSKEEYVKILPERLAGNPSVALGKPKMTVSGHKAEVKIYMTRGNYNGLVVYDMILENNKWYIQGWKY